MGYIRHDAIVVTSFSNEYISKGRAHAIALGLDVSEIVESTTNGYLSFLIAPDGSKEGWTESDNGDGARNAWKQWANSNYRTGTYLDWVHVSYAGDERKDTKIVEQALRKEE